MKAKHLCLLLLPFVAISAVRGQDGDDLPIPMESDNRYPPDQQAAPDDEGILEGSGAIPQPEAIDDLTRTTSEHAPIEEAMSGTNQILDERDIFDNPDKADNDNLSCPDNCLCNVEGEDFVTDCSGLELTSLPSNIDSKTTKLKLQNNKLTEIPKEISVLNYLKELNASSNKIDNIALGSISSLSELRVLGLENNRLLEYPTDLKNSFYLTKLQILNLGGNDIREPLDSEVLVKFTSLEKIVVPAKAYNDEIEVGLCKSLTSSLKIICVETCEKEVSCPNSPDAIEEGMLDAPPQLPGALYTGTEDESDVDPTVSTSEINVANNEAPVSPNTEIPLESSSQPEANLFDNKDTATSDLETKSTHMRRSEIEKELEIVSQDINSKAMETDSAKEEESPAISRFNTLVEKANPTEIKDTNVAATETGKPDANDSSNYKVGATTSDSKASGVDKSVIGIIVAGMVVVVAGITIQKNWTSIKKRFSSNSRTPDHPAGNTNGTTAPEEVPLQDKSPV